jgi:hypothetical protein
MIATIQIDVAPASIRFDPSAANDCRTTPGLLNPATLATRKPIPQSIARTAA